MAGAQKWLWACTCGKGGVTEGEPAVRKTAEAHADTTGLMFTYEQESRGVVMPQLMTHSVSIGPVADLARVSRPKVTWASASCAGSTE
jgi:hypothetical protein